MRKALQKFSDERLELDKNLSPTQIAQFLEDFREQLSENTNKSKLISIRVKESLLRSFQDECSKQNVKYQKKIKELMIEWLIK